MSIETRYFKVDDLALRANPRTDVVADRTVRFSVDEHQYEIDLTNHNAAGFYDAIRPYTEAARPVRRPSRKRPKVQRDATAKIRQWAIDNGYDVNRMGRIPRDVLARYEAAMGT